MGVAVAVMAVAVAAAAGAMAGAMAVAAVNRGFGDCRRLAGATDSCQGLRTLSAAQNFGAKVLSHFRVFGLHHLLVSQVVFQVGWCHKWCHKWCDKFWSLHRALF